MTGRFITFEGGEGAGKSTQAQLLAQALQARGLELVITREPGGTPGAEAIRALLLDTKGTDWELPAEALLFAAARADHVAQLIRPAIDRDAWVICDRFIDSSRAYQGGEGALADATIMALHSAGSAGFMPDLTLLIELSPAEAARRLTLRDGDASDRIGGRDSVFHSKVARRFGEIADAEPQRIARIDGEGDPATVHSRILAAVTARLGLAA